ncbi:MAG: hypothetical protein ACW967_07195 [Candidatus Hodarchaeales archaeon]|jgi:hypothetical protein
MPQTNLQHNFSLSDPIESVSFLNNQEIPIHFSSINISIPHLMQTVSCNITGWLLDVYPVSNGIISYWTTKDGQTYQAFVPDLKGRIYLQPNSNVDLIGLAKQLKYLEYGDTFGCTIHVVSKFISLHHPYKTNVIEIQVPINLYTTVYEKILKERLPVTYFNADLAPSQHFFLETGLFPFCKCELSIKDGKLVKYRLVDDIKLINYELPPVKAWGLSFEFASTLHLSTPLKAILTPMHQNITTPR